MNHRLFSMSTLTAILYAATMGQAAAIPVQTPDLTLIPLTTSGTAYFLNSSGACADIGGNQFCVLSAVHVFFPPPLTFDFSGGNEVETTDSEVIAQVSVNGGPVTSAELFGPATVTAYGRTSDSEVGTFATRMDFDLTGSIGGIPVQFRSRSNQPTTGSSTFSVVNGTNYTDSYFHVFPEISVNGSPFVPEISPTTQVANLQALPEPPTVALLGLGFAPLARIKRGKLA